MTPVKRIGKYELEDCLGGGMAWVWRARDTVIGRTVAVKILKETAKEDPDSQARFLQEAKVAGSLAHDNIVRIFDYGEDGDGHPYIVMEFLPGEDLSRAIKGGRAGSLPRKVEIAREAALALAFIHSRGIIHRDIKPDNICITERGQVKLMDFGIAKVSSVTMTQAGFTIGTPPYMAPEQIRGEPANRLMDIYAFGAVLYELLAGVKAFDGEGFLQVFEKVLNSPANMGPVKASGAPPVLCKLVERCLAKNPAERPQTFEDVIAELDAVEFEEPAPTEAFSVSSEPAKSAGLPRRTLLAAGAGFLALFCIVLIGLKLRNKATPTEINTPTGLMVLVAGGPFLYGESKQSVNVAPFYMDRTEVTNAHYAAFCKATGHPTPPSFASQAPHLPVVNVSYQDADAFAKWAGKRLPTSMEWEKAGRGADGRRYPWGEQDVTGVANVAVSGAKGSLREVSNFAAGKSPSGVLQIVGNVWELVDETASPTPAQMEKFKPLSGQLDLKGRWVKIRGGSYAEPLDPNVMWDAVAVPAGFRNHLIGFRCAKNATGE